MTNAKAAFIDGYDRIAIKKGPRILMLVTLEAVQWSHGHPFDRKDGENMVSRKIDALSSRYNRLWRMGHTPMLIESKQTTTSFIYYIFQMSPFNTAGSTMSIRWIMDEMYSSVVFGLEMSSSYRGYVVIAKRLCNNVLLKIFVLNSLSGHP